MITLDFPRCLSELLITILPHQIDSQIHQSLLSLTVSQRIAKIGLFPLPISISPKQVLKSILLSFIEEEILRNIHQKLTLQCHLLLVFLFTLIQDQFPLPCTSFPDIIEGVFFIKKMMSFAKQFFDIILLLSVSKPFHFVIVRGIWYNFSFWQHFY